MYERAQRKIIETDSKTACQELEEMGLAAPQVTYIVHKLKEKGLEIETDAITIKEAAEDILAALKAIGRV